ncbi:MAG: hypothetical protein KDB26_13935, partial [Microthrixaceae bacterium]|nr:hypothetical protein [Microthrixaceae bacterium]
ATSYMVIVQIGGVLATVAVCIAAWNLSRPLSSTGKGAPIIGLRMAVFYLVVTAAFGITYAFNRGAFWFDMLDNRVLAHAHLGLLGWLGLAYVAVAEKLWPMFLLAHRPHVRAGERAVVTLSIGVPILALAMLWPSKVLTCVGAVVVLAGLGFHLSSLASVIKHRRRGLELLHGFVLTSAACLVIAAITGGIGVIASVGSFSADVSYRFIPAEVLALILWLALAVIGHAHKIVPFISWNRLRDMGIMTGRDGRPLLFAHLVNQDLARATFALAALAAASGIAGTLGAAPLLVRVSGIALGAAGAIAIANLVSGPLLMIKWHNQQTSAENSAAVDKDTAHVSNQ